MRHVTYGAKSMLMDDHTADLLLEYAAQVAGSGTGDTVVIHAVSPDGNEVDVTFLLNANTELVAETARTQMIPPANDEAIAYLRDRIHTLKNPPNAQPVFEQDDDALTS